MKVPLPDGIGSGIKIKELVDDLVKAEGQEKITKFDNDETKQLAKISAYGILKQTISDFSDNLTNFQDADQFGLYSATATTYNNIEIISASASEFATPGNYLVEVDQLALAQKSGSISFANSGTMIGTGNLIFTIGTSTYTYAITSANNTVQGINDTINAQSSITGITSNLIGSNNGVSMVFSAKTGTNYAFTVSVTDDGDGNNTDASGLSQLASNNLTLYQPAQNAILKIEGVPVISDSNTVEYAIAGVTINLLSTDVNNPITLSINVDMKSAQEAIHQFVESYNKVFEVIKKLTQPAAARDKSKTKGPLVGDSSLRTIEFQMRNVINQMMTSQPAGFSTLSQIGITSDPNTGLLVIDEPQLLASLNANFSAVAKLFNNPNNGIVDNMNNCLEPYIEVNGIIQTRTQGCYKSIEVIDEHRLILERHLKNVEKRYTSQFVAMEMMITKLNSLREYLTQQLESLPEPMMFKK